MKLGNCKSESSVVRLGNCASASVNVWGDGYQPTFYATIERKGGGGAKALGQTPPAFPVQKGLAKALELSVRDERGEQDERDERKL